MKVITYLAAWLLGSFLLVSCGQSSRQEAHEDVVQEERTEEDALVGLEANQQEEREIDIVAANMRYEPQQIRVQAGQQLNITLLNQGDEEHSIEFELPDGEQMLQNPVKPSQSQTLEFAAPQKAGTYTFYCPVNNHREKGMTGQLIVE